TSPPPARSTTGCRAATASADGLLVGARVPGGGRQRLAGEVPGQLAPAEPGVVQADRAAPGRRRGRQAQVAAGDEARVCHHRAGAELDLDRARRVDAGRLVGALAVLVARLAADDDDVVAQPQDRRGAAVVAGPADGVAGRHVDGVVRDPGALDGADDVPGAAGDEEGAALQRGGDDVEGEDVAGGGVALLRAELAEGVVVVGPVVGDPVPVASEDLDGGAVDAVVVALGVAAGDGVAGDEVVVAVEQDAEGAGVVVAALVVDAHPVVVGEPAVADRVAGGARGDGDAGHVAVGLHPGQHV